MLSQEKLAQYDRDGYVLVSGINSGRDNCQCRNRDEVCPWYGSERSGVLVSVAGRTGRDDDSRKPGCD